ncbi:MAG: hypothetical protein KDJ52_30185, partial [Anaerolineae bacterium]|nr:hypothetical protein [Anaerolineae bacterium]
FFIFICVYLRKSASKKIKIMPVGSISTGSIEWELEITHREHGEFTNSMFALLGIAQIEEENQTELTRLSRLFKFFCSVNLVNPVYFYKVQR